MTPELAGRQVVDGLREAGHVALWAGGCVRDRLLGRDPNDIDVATSATPKEVRGLFRRTLRVGEQFGIIIVLHGEQQTEVATFRAEGTYSDGRRPDEVTYSQDPREDAQRRDFTVNGLFYDPVEDQVHDFVDGMADILRGRIRAIGDPAKRFGEDKLRILRAPRFAAVLGFGIEAGTAEAARRHAPDIRTAGVSPERIHTELNKLLACPGRAHGLALCRELELLPVVLPEAVAETRRLERALALLPDRVDPSLAWAVTLHVAGAEAADVALRRLRSSNKEREGAVQLLRDLPTAQGLSACSLSQQKRLLREAHADDLAELLRVTALAGDGDLEPYRYLTGRLTAYRADEGPTGLGASLLVQGRDLREAGLKPGPLFGRLLPRIEDAQLEGRVTTREEALALALELAKGDP